MKTKKTLILGSALVLAVAGLSVNAQDRGGMSLAAAGGNIQRMAARSKQQNLEAIRTNRDDAISDMVYRLIPPDAAAIDRYQFEAMLGKADTKTLVAVSQTWDFDQARAILLKDSGDNKYAASAFGANKSLGDVGSDYVYTAVQPCRILDTRPAAGGAGILNAGTTMDVFVWGDGTTIGGQGGDPAGCSSPRGEPRAVHVNATVVPTGRGFLTVYPANIAQVPVVSLINYQTGGTPIANAGIIQTNYDLVGEELRVYTSRSTHVIMDVLGYFHEVNSIDPSLLPVPPANVVGTIQTCARDVMSGIILYPAPYEDWSSFCFASSGVDDNRTVATSYLWTGLAPATYEFGICGWQGNDGACGLNTNPEPYHTMGTKVTVVVTDSLGDSTILHQGYDLGNGGPPVTADVFSLDDPTFLSSNGDGNTTIAISAGDSVLIQGNALVHACDEDWYGVGDCSFPAPPP